MLYNCYIQSAAENATGPATSEMPYERLKTFYVCKKCNTVSIFRRDMEDHQRMTGHAETLQIPLDGRFFLPGKRVCIDK